MPNNLVFGMAQAQELTSVPRQTRPNRRVYFRTTPKFIKKIWLATFILSCASAHAEKMQPDVLGLKIGATPEQVKTTLESQ